MTFPRTDPAVIMLVEHRPESGPSRCLLARNARFPSRMMSTLAGFVDPSESLEETVEREVYEESGIQVTNVTYQASQPWPFPSSIMLGFHALALTTEIRIDSIEIEEAGWFSAEQLGNFGEWGDAGDGYCLPRKDSIARYLIETWMAEVTRRP
jgi:NAD+ diphosphatase